MPHQHYCDVAGHFWECEGTALRPDAGDTEPSTCMCVWCGLPMEQGDHSGCPVELLACPEHHNGQHQVTQEGGTLTLPLDFEQKSEHAFDQLRKYAAVCFWCGHGYEEYSREAEDEHFAHHCPDAPQELVENARKRLENPPVDTEV